LALLVGLVTTLAAADPDDLRIQDLRLQAGLPPAQSRVDAHFTSLAFKRADDITWDQRGRWSLQWAPPIRPVTTSGSSFCLVEVTSYRLVSAAGADGSRLRERALLGGLHLGLAWAVLQDTAVEVTGSAAGGRAWQEQTAHQGNAWEVGARAAVTWAPRGAWGHPLVGAGVLATASRFAHAVTLDDAVYDLVISTTGLTPVVTVGWRF